MLIGRLGKDAETRYTPNGAAVTNFSIATTYRSKDGQTGEWKESTDWHDVVVWRAEKVAEYLTKGRQVYIEGRLQTRNWEDQNGQKRYRTEVVADNFSLMLLGGRDGGGGGGGDFAPGAGACGGQPTGGAQPTGGGQPSSAPSGGDDIGDQGVTDDDVPF